MDDVRLASIAFDKVYMNIMHYTLSFLASNILFELVHVLLSYSDLSETDMGSLRLEVGRKWNK